MSDDATPNTEEPTEEAKARAKNRLHGLNIDEVSGVGAGANKQREWLICKDGKGDPVDVEMAEWSTAYINDLPDSAFLFIESGGEKDDDGRTKPRSLRHLPYRDKDGKVDVPHLQNAISRAPQLKVDGLSQDDKEKLQEKARSILTNVQKSDNEPNQEPSMPGMLKIEKRGEKLDRAHDILWGAMDKLRERLYPADEAAQNAVLDAVVAAVGGEDTDVLMSDDAVAKAEEAIAEALAKVVEADPIAKSAVAIGLRPAPAPEPPAAQDPASGDDPEDVGKAGRKQMSLKRAKAWRGVVGTMVKLLQEMDPGLANESIWPSKQAKSDKAGGEDPPAPDDVGKGLAEIEAELAKAKAELATLKKTEEELKQTRAELAKAKRRPVPSNIQTDETPTVPVDKGKKTPPKLNMMNLNEGL